MLWQSIEILDGLWDHSTYLVRRRQNLNDLRLLEDLISLLVAISVLSRIKRPAENSSKVELRGSDEVEKVFVSASLWLCDEEEILEEIVEVRRAC